MNTLKHAKSPRDLAKTDVVSLSARPRRPRRPPSPPALAALADALDESRDPHTIPRSPPSAPPPSAPPSAPPPPSKLMNNFAAAGAGIQCVGTYSMDRHSSGSRFLICHRAFRAFWICFRRSFTPLSSKSAMGTQPGKATGA